MDQIEEDHDKPNPRCTCPARIEDPELSWTRHNLHLDDCPMYDE